MKGTQLSLEDVATLRQRVEYEDQLLNSRTSIVLTLNGLIAVAESCSLPASARLIAALIIIVINLFWIICSLDAQHFIHSLLAKINESGTARIDEKVRKEIQKGRFRFGSTRFMAPIVPILLLVGWILGLVGETLSRK